MKIGNFTLTAYTLYMGVTLLGRSPLDFYTKKVVEEGNKLSQPLPEDKKKYFVERSKELGYNHVNFDMWDLMLTDSDFMCFGDQDAAISLVPYNWPLTKDRSQQSIIETFKQVKKTYKNDTSLIDKITFEDIDNDLELRTQLIESYGIVPITRDEEDANIEIMNTTVVQHPSKDLTISNLKVFLGSFVPLVVISKVLIPHKFPVSLVHLAIPFIAVEVNHYTKDREQCELLYRQVYANSGASPLISYKRYLKAQMHLEKIKKIYSRTGDSIGYPWKTDKINTIDKILKENNISTTEFDQKQ